MAKRDEGNYIGNRKQVTTIGKGKNSRPMKKKCNKKRGVKKYRGQGK